MRAAAEHMNTCSNVLFQLTSNPYDRKFYLSICRIIQKGFVEAQSQWTQKKPACVVYINIASLIYYTSTSMLITNHCVIGIKTLVLILTL